MMLLLIAVIIFVGCEVAVHTGVFGLYRLMGHEGPYKERFSVLRTFGLLVVALLIVLSLIRPHTSGPHPRKSRDMRAASTVNIIGTALAGMLSDAGRSSLTEFLDPNALRAILGFDPVPGPKMTREQFELLEEVYTDTVYSLLRYGRSALERDYVPDGLTFEIREILDEDALKKLGTSYMDLQEDPWGERYRFWIGPWPDSEDAPPIPFRIYRPKDTAPSSDTPASMDPWVLNATGRQDVRSPNTDDYKPFGFPAPKDLPFYIYSTGADRTSGQAIAGGPLEPTNYVPGRPAHLGGGDDINNWDRERSWSVFYR